MANPRKFSEKIALHNQKQAEETAAFEQIMREVSDATSKVNSMPKQHLLINQTSLGSFRGGSLPNVNHIASNTVDSKENLLLQSAFSNVEEIKTSHNETPVFPRERGRSPGVGPMRSRPIEKRIDTSPYSSGAYLSPPPDTSWRRTNSDSALHQTAMNITGDSSLHSPGSQRRVNSEHHSHLLGMTFPEQGDHSRTKHLMVSADGRPRSCCDVPRVPGINIYPSQHEPGTVQIPIGNNTGSLPDLTSFHFPSPLPTPLDQEDPNNSPYSTGSQNASPSTLSPTSLPSRPPGRFPFGTSLQDSQGGSPGHSPGSRRRHYPQQHLQNLVIDPQSPTQQTSNHLSVPVNSRYLHTCKGVTLDNGGNVQPDTFQQNQYLYQQQNHLQQQQQHHHQQQQQQQQQNNPSLVSSSQNIPTHHLNSLNTYRSPQPISRPSPQTSPCLAIQGGPLVYRSGSPGGTSLSGPQSPISPASSPGIGSGSSPFSDHSGYFMSQAQANALQQHFEQFNMLDNPVSTSMDYISSHNNTTHYSQAVSQEECLSLVGSQELSTDPGYYSQSPSSHMHYSRPNVNPSGGSTQQTTPQTPNTPTSIPDIILTDFSNAGDELSRQEFVKDLGSAMSGSFDSDVFPSDETLREGLDPIDFDDFQMLTDPDMNVITDPSTEDKFRLDRL